MLFLVNAHNRVFGKRIYHVKNVPSLLSSQVKVKSNYMQGLYFYGRYCAELIL